MGKKEKEKSLSLDVGRSWREWIKRDFIYIIVCLIALLICMVSLLDVANYQEQCNDHWVEQWENSGCGVVPNQFNQSYAESHIWSGGFENGIKDQD